jgi:hypothetical protein
VLALGLTLTLLAAPEAVPSARLVPQEPLLSAAEVLGLDRELRILDGNIQLLRPAIPQGFVIGMFTGFSFSVLLLPGIPLLVVGATGLSPGAFIAFGGVLTALGGVSLAAALICAVLGTNVEAEMAEERARLVERRDALEIRLGPYRPPPQQQQQPPSPGFPPESSPGVQRDLPTPPLVTLARF